MVIRRNKLFFKAVHSNNFSGKLYLLRPGIHVVFFCGHYVVYYVVYYVDIIVAQTKPGRPSFTCWLNSETTGTSLRTGLRSRQVGQAYLVQAISIHSPGANVVISPIAQTPNPLGN